MRVGIMTFHTALNYGAVLQTFALYKTIKEMGNDVKVIDYRAPFNEKRFAPKPFSYFLNIRVLYNIIFRNGYEIYYKDGFRNFVDKHIQLTEPLYDEKELFKMNDIFDSFISGSDQVWNLACTEGDTMYYLPFVKDSCKRNTYAASIGYTQLPTTQISIYKTLIESFNNISMRELPGVSIVKSLTDKDASLVLDPTMLLCREQWEEIADFSLVPLTGKYMLIYVMSEDKSLIKEARKIAKLKGLEVIYITQRLFKLNKAKNLRNVTPEQWVGLFLKADFVVTNSFHGLAFSINFNRQFITRYIPRSIANSRMQTVLDILQLHNRRMDNDSYTSETPIDYSRVNNKINQYRKSSIEFLDKVLNNDKSIS